LGGGAPKIEIALRSPNPGVASQSRICNADIKGSLACHGVLADVSIHPLVLHGRQERNLFFKVLSCREWSFDSTASQVNKPEYAGVRDGPW
jgi:hypothetical protein